MSTPAPDNVTPVAARQQVRAGDCVAVTPLPGYRAVTGVVVRVHDTGFDIVELPARRDAPITGETSILWERVETVQPAEAPATLLRVYIGNQQADTAEALAREAALLGQAGYRPTTQSWAQGQWGCGAWLVALLLSILVIGLVVFLFLVIVKPDGTLTVTFARDVEPRREAAPAVGLPSDEAPAPALAPTFADRLSQLEAARAAGLRQRRGVRRQARADHRQPLGCGLAWPNQRNSHVRKILVNDIGLTEREALELL